jgi:hypothetical protein
MMGRVLVCEGGCCTRYGARAVASAARRALADHGLEDQVEVVPVRCIGRCALGPYVRVATAAGGEPAGAAAFREEAAARTRAYAASLDYPVDRDVELNLSRFAARVQPDEAERLALALAVPVDLPAAGEAAH